MKNFLILTVMALPINAGASILSVTEGIPATNDTIMVDINTGRVGISTAVPQVPLHVVTGNSTSIVNGVRLENRSTTNGSGSKIEFTSGSNVMVDVESSQLSTHAGEFDIKLFTGLSTPATTMMKIIPGSIRIPDNIVIFGTGTILIRGQEVATGSGLTVAHSTATKVDITGSTGQTSFSACQSTNTITVSSSCQAIEVYYSGATQNNTTTSACMLNYMQDGAFVFGNSGTGVSFQTIPGANKPYNSSFQRLGTCPTPGVHSYCLSLATLANTCSYSVTAFVGNEFGVMELK